MVSRIAFVTGAAQGIGEGISLRLADEEIDVVLLDIPSKEGQLREVAKQVEAKGRKALVILGDVSIEDEVKAAITNTVEVLGGLDIMVANAGVVLYKSFLDTTTEEFRRVQAVNVEGVLHCFKYAALQMIQQGRGGRIIGASSLAGKRGTSGMSAYTASKFAVRGLTQAAAQELRAHKITVNAYAPGLIATEMIALPDDEHLGGRGEALKQLAGLPADVPIGTPSAIAELVAYLIKPEAYFITGQSLTIDGGIYFD